MLLNIVIAAFMMVVTTAIHAGGMILSLRIIRSQRGSLKQRLQQTYIYSVGGIVLLMFLVSLIEVLVWAAAYLGLNAIQGFEQALYFSMVTFTTLGYGDIVLDERWRLLTSFEAANGIIMFGWTTAIVIASVQRIYFNKESLREQKQDRKDSLDQ
ncbi:MAG: potassium channel family protein [Planctomycetota bacterium]|jgi:voltage-gated potassium channel Kch